MATKSVIATETTKSKKLLVVDDEEQNIQLVQRAFRGEFEVYEARDGQEALEKARQLQPDVIITDQRMPNMTGVEFLTALKEELPNTIRVLITGYTDYGSLVDAVNAARVHHYFEKPFHTVDLKTVVDTLLRTKDLEDEKTGLVERLANANRQLADREVHLEEVVELRTRELSVANQQLKELAVRDGLTGLFNRRYLLEHLQIELARSYRYKREFCVLFIDVDDFKSVNDNHGHAIGDEVLIRIADLLRPNSEGLRRSDFVARYGGEEFCVILPETPLRGGEIKAERIRDSIEKTDWTKIENKVNEAITVSIGVAAYPKHGNNAESLIEAADLAQYQAKRQGKNCVIVSGGFIEASALVT